MAMQAMGYGLGAITSLLGKKDDIKNARQAAQEQYNYNLALQKDAQEFNERMFRNRLQYVREDALKAGINPLYGAGLNAASPTSGTNSVGMPDYAGAYNNKEMRRLEGIRIGQEFASRSAEIENIRQKTQTERMNTLIKSYDIINTRLDALLRKKNLDSYDIRLKQELSESKSRIESNIASATKSYAEGESARAAKEGIELDNENKRRNLKNRTQNPLIDGFNSGAADGGGTVGGLIGAFGNFMENGWTPSEKWKSETLDKIFGDLEKTGKGKNRTYSARGKVIKQNR